MRISAAIEHTSLRGSHFYLWENSPILFNYLKMIISTSAALKPLQQNGNPDQNQSPVDQSWLQRTNRAYLTMQSRSFSNVYLH